MPPWNSGTGVIVLGLAIIYGWRCSNKRDVKDSNSTQVGRVIFENVSVVKWVPTDGPGVIYMRAGNAIMGGRWIDEDLASEPVFLNFAIQQMCLYVHGGLGADREVLQLGLGAGSAATFLREHDVRVDVVELNPQVVQAAAEHFNYDRSEGSHGSTYIADARAFLQNRTTDHRYAVVLHDVFMGFNPWLLMSKDIFASIRERWLLPDGKLIMNFVGYHTSSRTNAAKAAAHRLTARLLQMLRSEFASVRCFREIPLDMYPDKMANLLFVASTAEGSVPPKPFAVPAMPEFDSGEYYLSPQWTQIHFQEWEVTGSIEGALAEESRSVAVGSEELEGLITDHTLQDEFVLAQEEIARGYREMVSRIYPPAEAWADAAD